MMFGKMKKLAAVVGALMIGASVFAGCGGGEKPQASSGASSELTGKVTASGSTALLPLLKPAQEAFQTQHGKVTVNIAGGGSFTGMNQVAEGSVQIGDSDVNLPAEYKDKGLVDHKVVVEPFVFIVDKANPVDNLTKQQVIDILTGKITNWKEVGGADQPITLIHRAKSSGFEFVYRPLHHPPQLPDLPHRTLPMFRPPFVAPVSVSTDPAQIMLLKI